jgi:hypothetical protein
MLLQEMRRPGVYRVKMIVAGLRSPAVNNRNMAITALKHRPVERWQPAVVSAVRQAVAEEPNAVRQRVQGLVNRLDSVLTGTHGVEMRKKGTGGGLSVASLSLFGEAHGRRERGLHVQPCAQAVLHPQHRVVASVTSPAAPAARRRR